MTLKPPLVKCLKLLEVIFISMLNNEHNLKQFNIMSSASKAKPPKFSLKTQNSGQDTMVEKFNFFSPKIMIHFCHLIQWNSRLNSFKSYPNNRFYHLQPLNDFYCYIKLSFLIIFGWKKEFRISNFVQKIWNLFFIQNK